MSSCASYVSRTHDVTDDVSRSQSGSNFKIAIFPSIFELEHRSKAQNSEMLMAILLVCSTSGITSIKKFVVTPPFWKFWNITHSFNFTSDMKRESQIMQKKYVYDDDVIDDVTGWHESCPLYSCLGEVGSGNKLQGQCLVNKCEYRHRFLGFTCLKKILINNIFRDRRSKVNVTSLLGDLGT